VSEIRMPNSTGRIWLGSYDTPEKAARAYDFAMYYLRGSKAKLNFPEFPPVVPSNSSLSPQQIQAAAKFAAEEFRLPSEDGAACSSSDLETICNIDGQQITEEQSPAFWDSLSLEALDNCDSLILEDFPPLDVSAEDLRNCF